MIWIKRLLLLAATIFFAMTLTFLIIRLMPGDPVETMALNMVRDQGADYKDAYERAKAMLNYDPEVPLFIQYGRYVSSLATGSLGISMMYRKSITQIIAGALPWTLLVLTISLFISFLLGILIGMYISWKRKTVLDPVLSVYASIMGSVPEYVIAFILVIIFSMKLRWFPSRGAYSSSVIPGFNMAYILSVLYHAVLPISAYIIAGIGGWALNMKGNAVNVLGEDYITAARARGLSQRRIVTRYVGRNALLPLVTNLAISFGMVFGGSPLIEYLFVYPGVGYFLNQAIANRDYLLMQGMFLMITVTVVIANLLAEILYTVLDPRIRVEG